MCVVLTTHELAEAERMADRIVILSSGRIALEGTPHDLTTGTGTGIAQPVVTFGAPPALDTEALAEAVGPRTVVTETTPGRYRVQAMDLPTPAVTAAIATFLAEHGATLTDLVAGKTLEDVYFEAVGAAAVTADTETLAPVRPGRRGRRGTR